jgi:myosin protein heavy chain
MTNNEATRTLRDHIEELEMRVMRRTEQIGIHQHDIRRLETNLRLQEERLGEMTVELEMMAAQKDAMVEDCADAREARDEAIGRAEALEEEMEAVEGRNDENKALVTNLIAVIAETVARAREAIGQARAQATGAKHDLFLTQKQQGTLQQELDEKLASFLDLTKQSDENREELQKVRLALIQCQTEAKELSILAQNLQEEKAALEAQIVALKEQADESNILQNQNKDLLHRIQEKERAGATNDDAERVLVQVKLQHADAIGKLQIRLVETESALEELQMRYKSSEQDHQREVEDAKASIHGLEQRLDATSRTLAELTQTHEQVDALEKEHAKRIIDLQDQLDKTSKAQQDALKSRDDLHTENVRLAHEMDQLQQENDSLLSRSQDDKLAVQQELEKKVQSLQGRFEEETRLLQISKEEAARLELRLRVEAEGRAQDHKAHGVELSSANKQYELAEESISQLRADLATLQENLEVKQGYLAAAEEEKTILQQDITTFEAEVQKSKSLSRFLEAQIKDRYECPLFVVDHCF